MGSCEYCDGPFISKDVIFEGKYWNLLLARDQSYLGRCTLVTKRHVSSIGDCNEEEQKEYLSIMKHLELAFRNAFGATMTNVTCMMNNSFKEKPYTPHVHWHIRPRYDSNVIFEGITFTDPDFAKHYDRTRKTVISESIRIKIKEKLHKVINC